MRIISLIILISFLFTNTAYPSSTLRVPVGQIKTERTKEVTDEAAYLRIAEWIATKLYSESSITGHQEKEKIEEIVTELKAGKVNFIYKQDGRRPPIEVSSTYKVFMGDDTKITVNLRRGIMLVSSHGGALVEDYRPLAVDIENEYYTVEMPEEILELASRILGVKVFKADIKYYDKSAWITSRPQLWKLRLGKMTEDDIGKYLRLLGKDALAEQGFKRAIAKKLTRLQQKRPETVDIIRKKALELLEIDEDIFKEALEPFIGDYIKIREVIHTRGISSDTAEFYNLFDVVAEKIDQDSANVSQVYNLVTRYSITIKDLSRRIDRRSRESL